MHNLKGQVALSTILWDRYQHPEMPPVLQVLFSKRKRM